MHLNTGKQITEWVLTSAFIHEVMAGRLNNTQVAYLGYIEEIMKRTRNFIW